MRLSVHGATGLTSTSSGRSLRDHRQYNQDVKAYVMTTGVVFGLITLAHIWRVIEEGMHLAETPWYILITLATAALCFWAFSLLWRAPRS